MVVLQAQGLTKRYRDVVALHDVDLTVEAGELIALLGPNGAGKTSLIEILLGIRAADAGRVEVLGGAPTARAIRARVGAMLQDTEVPESQTVREVVDLTRHYYPWALPQAEILARSGLAEKAGTRVRRLSGGQRQRLSFAMAIAGDPELLFLDEPTAALDVEARRSFWAQIRELTAAGTTVLFSLHHPDEVQGLVDRVVITGGRIVADGTVEQVQALAAADTLEGAYLALTGTRPSGASSWESAR